MTKISECFVKRQQHFLQQIGNDSIAIIFAAKELAHHRMVVCPFHQDNDFYYLTGFEEAEAIAVFIPYRKEGEYILFCQDKDKEAETWTGPRVGQEGACKFYGAKQAFSLSDVEKVMPELVNGHEKIYFNFGDEEDYHRVMQWAKVLGGKIRSGVNPPHILINTSEVIHEMRLIKDELEISIMRKAAEIAAQAQLRVMDVCQPGMMEYELEAEISHEFIRSGGRMPSFEPIVAGGANACTLHYSQNTMPLLDKDLVLVDIGVLYKNYASDVTRTFPVSGKYSKEQRQIYELVLETQLGIIANIQPGVAWNELQEISEQIITKGLLELGLLQGDFATLLSAKAFRQFYMHHFGHWLGLEAHDPSKHKTNEGWRKLAPGMVLTVEPGIYIPENTPNIDPKWFRIGVRIEDDVLVTRGGCEVLSAKVPKTVAEIEMIMKK